MAEPGERLPLINEDHSARGTYENGQGPQSVEEGWHKEDWEFAGFGQKEVLTNLVVDEEEYKQQREDKKKHELGQLLATSISGNDIASSCLYTIGVCVATAGIWAPVSLALVIVVLVLYKSVYSEVGSAIPLNGGSYNCLLNTTTKLTASLAATLTIISYVATAVVSADSAIHYLNFLLQQHAGVLLNPLWATIALMAIFGLLNLLGIGESAFVAFLIFSIHLTCLTILMVAGFVAFVSSDFSVLKNNWNRGPIINIGADIYFGFCAAMLGVTGFESSSNYIEEQKPGVFPQTLRNMTIVVGIFNPVLGFLAVALLDVASVTPDTAPQVLANLGQTAAGPWLGYVIGIDAVVVLSGAVLTAYVGVTGLIRRMSLDRCLPQFLIQENSLRKTNHWIIFGFFAICTSLYEAVRADVTTITGVYTVAFLSVLALFAVGNLLIKYKRSRLPRDTRAPIAFVVIGFAMVVAALVGNIVRDLTILEWFALYFAVTLAVVLLMLTRTRILKWMSKSIFGYCCASWLKTQIAEINRREMIFFTKDDSLETINKAVLYVRANELTNTFRIVHVYESDDKIPANLVKNVQVIDEMYPKMRIDLTLVKGSFTPALVNTLAREMDVPKNFMYLTCPSDQFKHNISEFGGVRVITH